MNLARRSLLRTAGALTAVCAMVVGPVGLPVAAQADTARFGDTRGDIGHGADIHWVRVVNEKAVRVVIQHRNLVRSYKSGTSGSVYLDTNRHRPGPEFIFLGAFFQGADYALARARNWHPKESAVPLVCPYMMRLDYAADRTYIKIGRDCLGSPGRIRVAVKTGGGTAGSAEVDWLGSRREFSPWVARG